MPINYIKSLSKKHNISVEKLEKEWDKAKDIAKEADRKDDFAYIVGIFKKLISKFGIKESLYIVEGKIYFNKL